MLEKTVKIANKYFSIELYEIDNGATEENADGEKFSVYIICSGAGKITYDGGELDVKMGETLLIPAAMGEYKIEGTLKAVKSYVPNLQKDVIDVLLKNSFSIDEINKNVEGLQQ